MNDTTDQATLTVEIPADVKDNSETVTDYAFRRDLSPHTWPHTIDERVDSIRWSDDHGYVRYWWHDVSPDGQRCRFDWLLNVQGGTAHLFHTEYYTRVACAHCDSSYAERFIREAGPDAEIALEPVCGFHLGMRRKTVENKVACGHRVQLIESEPLRIGQHD